MVSLSLLPPCKHLVFFLKPLLLSLWQYLSSENDKFSLEITLPTTLKFLEPQVMICGIKPLTS